MPRPMRFRSPRRCAGLRVERFSSAIVDLDEMPDLAKHACNHGGFVVLDRLADLPEAQCPQRAAMPLALADRAADLRDADLAHAFSSPPRAASVTCPWGAPLAIVL